MRQDSQRRPAVARGARTASPPWRQLTALLVVALVSAGTGVFPRTVQAQDGGGHCPVNLEQGDPCTPSGKIDPGAAPSGSRPSTMLGNPVSLVTGNKTQTEVDYAAGDAPLAFRRHYASANADANLGLGHGWRHSYAVSLSAAPDGARRIIDATGRHVWFHPPEPSDSSRPSDDSTGPLPPGSTRAGSGVSPTERRRHRGRAASDGYLLGTGNRTVWHPPDGRRLSFLGSWLTRIEWPDGRHLALRYHRRQLASVTDETGRRIAFDWTPGRIGLIGFDANAFTSHSGHLAAVVLPDGQRVHYDYDERQNLTRVRFEDGTDRRYHYESPLWPNHLSGLTDRTGTRRSSWHYDERGRAVSSERADGIERVELAFHAPENHGGAVGDDGHTVVTATDGRRTTYRWRRHLATGASLLLEARGPGCASCPPSDRRYAYTEDGQLVSTTRLAPDGTPLARRSVERDSIGRPVALTDTLYGADDRVLERSVERREYADAGTGRSAGGLASGLEGRSANGSADDGLLRDTEPTWRPVRVFTPSVRDGYERVLEIDHGANGLPLAITEHGFAPVPSVRGGTGFETSTETGTGSPAPAGAGDGNVPENAAEKAIDGTAARSPDWKAITRTTRLGYENGRLVRIDGPREDVEDVTHLDRDATGRLVAIHPPAAPALHFLAFDAHGRPSEIRVGRRTPFTLRRDANGRVIEVHQGDNAVRYRHDGEGRLVSVTDPFGRSMTLEHDAAGRLASVGDDLGRVARLFHDLEGRVIERSLSGIDGTLVKSLEQVLDAEGRISGTRETQSGGATDGSSTVHESLVTSDASGYHRTIADVGSRSRVSVDLDPFARTLAVERHDGQGVAGRTAVRFDALGQDVALTDALGNTTRFPKDDFGRVVFVDNPDTDRVTYRHDAAGNRVEARHEDGRLVRSTYDAAGRLTSRRTTDANGRDEIARWRWDETNGVLLSVENPAATERFEHDDDARLVRHDRVLGGHTFSTRYAYDAHGRLNFKRLPDGQSLRYHYHADGPNRGTLRAITRPGRYGIGQRVLVGEIDLETRDGSAGYLSHNGLRHRRTYAPDGTLRSVETIGGMRLDYAFDASGRIVGITEDGVAQRYRYDAGRLTSARTRSGDYVYLHDVVGDRAWRLHRSPNGEVQATEYVHAAAGDGNRLVATRGAIGGFSRAYRHDRAGAVVAIGGEADVGKENDNAGEGGGDNDLELTRNIDGRTVAVHRNGTLVAAYAYNPFGERVAKTVYSDGAAPRTTWFLHDGDTLSAEIDANGTVRRQYVYLDDYRPVAMLDGRDAYAIHGDHLGTPRAVTDDDGTTLWRASYTPFGRALVEHAMIDLPLRLPGQHTDAYAGADPLGTSDPFGLFGVDLLSGRDRPAVAIKPRAKESGGLSIGDFGYFALRVGEQYLGYARGFLNAAGETVLFAADVLRYSADNSPIALAVDLVYEDPPAWLPSFQRGQETSEQIIEVGEAILDDPALIWQAISDPYVSAWAECRYGEAIGRGVFEVGTALLPAGLAARLATLSRASRVATLADVLTVLRRGEAVAPEEYAGTLGRLVEEARANGTMDELVVAGRETGTLEVLLNESALARQDIRTVHAIPARPELGSIETLSMAANSPLRDGGVSGMARAIDKHSRRMPTAFDELSGNPEMKNAAALEVSRSILENPFSTFKVRTAPRFGEILDVRSPDGRGMRFSMDGTFIGLLEP